MGSLLYTVLFPMASVTNQQTSASYTTRRCHLLLEIPRLTCISLAEAELWLGLIPFSRLRVEAFF
jgi:hypothetical protein